MLMRYHGHAVGSCVARRVEAGCPCRRQLGHSVRHEAVGAVGQAMAVIEGVKGEEDEVVVVAMMRVVVAVVVLPIWMIAL